MRRILAYYRGKALKANSGRYFDGIVHNCCRVSAANNDLAFAIHRAGVFGGPVIEQTRNDYGKEVIRQLAERYNI